MRDLRSLLSQLDLRIGGNGKMRSPSTRSRNAPHIRDAMNVSRAMTCVTVALIPCILMAFFNTGYQTNLAMAELGIKSAPGWRGAILETFGIGYDPSSLWASLLHGVLYFLPVLAVATIIGSFWERLFARIRGRKIVPGLFLIALLFSLSLPPSIPLWQVALGISFGVVVAKEVFGGTGKNFLNPALAALAFLYATYPKQMVGENAWTVVEGFTGATSMRIVAGGGMDVSHWAGTNWMQSFLGVIPGAFGATSTLACLLGAVYLIFSGVASLRIMGGALFGMISTSVLFNQFVGEALLFADLPWYWHLNLGSFAFGVVFLATDPVTAAQTNTGRWIYGILIGAFIMVIRVTNISHPDGVMFAILFGNITAPLIDYLVMSANIRRRMQRYG